MKNEKENILVIGNTLAAKMAAVELASRGLGVALITGACSCAASTCAGDETLNAALDLHKLGDSVVSHVDDTLKFAEGIVPEQRVQQICALAPRVVDILVRAGVVFERTCEGYLKAHQGTGARYPRGFVGVAPLSVQTHAVLTEQVLFQQSLGRLKIYQDWECLSVILDHQQKCCGVVVQNILSGEMKGLGAKVVVLALNDLSGIYGNPATISSLSLLARVFEQGLTFENPEFVSFVPTSQAPCVEAALGGLGVDERFMTKVNGLFAVGGCAVKCHGANLLPGNGLLAELASALVICRYLPELLHQTDHSDPTDPSDKLFESAIKHEQARLVDLLEMTGPENVSRLFTEMADSVKAGLGPLRENRMILQTRMQLAEFKNRFQRLTLLDKGRCLNQELMRARSLAGALTIADAVAAAALLRNESRGVHQKIEITKKDDENFKMASQVVKTKDGVEVRWE
jgi:succinate dehydrogenase/fumarate reductase flavoprotein subunit